MESFREGFRFLPTDEELILRFLKPFCNKEPLVTDKIFEINLYDFTPDQLAGQYEKLNDKEWFFFTPREKRCLGGKRTSRITKTNGHWKITGLSQDITVNGKVIGKKSRLVYYIGKDQKANWFMYEYIYKDHDNNDPLHLDKALCKIYLNPERKRKTHVVVEEPVHVFLNPPLHSNHQQPQIDETLLRPFGLDQELLQQLQQQPWFSNSTLHSNKEQQQQQQQQEQEQNLQKLPLNPSLDTDKDQEREEEDVGEEVLKLLDLDEEQLQQPQEQEQSLFNSTLDLNQEQEQDQEQGNILCSFHLMKSNSFDAQQLPDLDDVRRQELLRQQQQQSDVLYMQQQQQQKLIREDEEDREQLQALLRDPVPDASYFIF